MAQAVEQRTCHSEVALDIFATSLVSLQTYLPSNAMYNIPNETLGFIS
jgi:hypothetical protein